MPDYLMQGSAMVLLAWVVFQTFTSFKPALEANTRAIVNLETLVKTLVDQMRKDGASNG